MPMVLVVDRWGQPESVKTKVLLTRNPHHGMFFSCCGHFRARADLAGASKNRGLFAGISVEGAVVRVRTSLNRSYFGKAVTPTDILVRRSVKNRNANSLLDAVKKAAAAS